MRRWKKPVIALAIIAVVAGIAVVSIRNRGKVVIVQAAPADRADVTALVTASGEIKPKNYADISANSLGQITAILVKEGDVVHRGQLLARLENIQQDANVQAMSAQVLTSQADVNAERATIITDSDDLQRTVALLQQAKQDWVRAQGLFKDKLIARQDYDAKQAAYESALAQKQVSEAKLGQDKAQLASLETKIASARANLRSSRDVLSKTEFISPLDGIVTYLPVHVGETVVMGVQNQPGSLVMRVADMSVVTAEVKVDETDIVNVKLGQPSVIQIDAYGDRKFFGTVTEVGDTAILRSTGLAATSDVSTDEAKDFKVVVTLSDPPARLRPGLSCTAKITTAVAKNAISIPIQAVVQRLPSDLETPKPGTAEASGPSPTRPDAITKQPIQGVFVIRAGKAVFVPVKTGVSGTDRIEVTSGLQPGDQVITGPYKALRTIRNHAAIKVDNSINALADQSAS
jgi:HlyD family secretion protein